jgi:hypothetical protein
VYLTIWNDPDFRNVPLAAQWLYFTMLTYPTLTSCGVMEWREPKLIKMAEGLDIPTLREAAWRLGQHRLIAVDPDTEEALVRSFVRHDGGLKSPNIAKMIVRDHATIASQKLMELVSIEVRRTIEEHPDYRGASFASPVAKQFPEPIGNPSDLVPDWFHSGSDSVQSIIPLMEGEPFQFGSSPSTSTSTQTLTCLSPVPADAGTQTSKSRKRPKTSLPDDWTPNEAHAEKAASLHLDLQRQVDKFRSSALANDRRYSDWDAAFRNWLTNAVEYAARDGLLRPAGGLDTPARPVVYGFGPDDE